MNRIWLSAGFAAAVLLVVGEQRAAAAVVRVPQDHATVQAAIDAAVDGDTVLVARGVYVEPITIAGKSITLASAYAESRDAADRLHTVLDGAVYGQEELVRNDAVITVAADAGPQTRIVGFTIRNGDDGISCYARIEIAENRFVNNNDAIDYEDGGGVCRDNYFIANQDDAIDVDKSTSVVISGNEIRDNADDGIEVRLHPYRGETLEVVIRDNVIYGSGEDGIQIIDYPEPSDRRLRIERNLIVQSVQAGIGFMNNADTREDYRSAHLPEPVDVLNNTLMGNPYGISGGGNAVVMNNLLVGCRAAGLKDLGSDAAVLHNICWDNQVDVLGVVPGEAPRVEDPGLDSRYRVTAGGPCTDAGVARGATPAGRSAEVDPAMVRGAAPDVGRDEH
jgi:hypothetical protein